MIELVDGMTKNKYDINYMDVFNTIDNMMSHEPGIQEVFYNKQDRLYASNPMTLIMFHGEPVGFLNLVQEDIDNIKFLDMGVLSKYRGLGIGTEAIKIFRPDWYKEYIIGETAKSNKPANRIGNDLGELVYRVRDKKFYLFQPHLLYTFMHSYEYQQLIDRGNEPKVLVKRLHR